MTSADVLKELLNEYPDAPADVFEYVVWKAASYFAECPEDFGIQHKFLPEGIVFGGTNRIIWTVRSGFYCDESYCTEDFIKRFKSYR
jgi:hypothetical protein